MILQIISHIRKTGAFTKSQFSTIIDIDIDLFSFERTFLSDFRNYPELFIGPTNFTNVQISIALFELDLK